MKIGKSLQPLSFLRVLGSMNFIDQISMPPHPVEDDLFVEGGVVRIRRAERIIREGVCDCPVADPIEDIFPQFACDFGPATSKYGKRKARFLVRLPPFGALRRSRNGNLACPPCHGRGVRRARDQPARSRTTLFASIPRT